MNHSVLLSFRSLSLLMRFGVLTAAAFSLFGVVLTTLVGGIVTDRGVASAERSADLVAHEVVAEDVRTADLDSPLEAALVDELVTEVESHIVEGVIVRFKLWSLDGTVRWSNDETAIGSTTAASGVLLAAIGGESGSKVVGDANDEHIAGVGRGRLVEAFVPIRVEGVAGSEVVAVAEVYLPYEPIASAAESDQRLLALVIGGGLMVLYIVSFGVVADASRRLRRFADEAEHESGHDSLTGLANRRVFLRRCERALLQAQRSDHAAAVMFLDLDRFKDINDTLGHDVGDVLLIEVSKRLTAALRGSDTIARLGGDEFGILIPHVQTEADPFAVATKVLLAFEEPFTIAELELDIGASIGIALSPDHATEANALMRFADLAMYEAKREGRTFAVYAAADDATSTDRLKMLGELRTAIRSGELVVHYQPKVELITGRPRSVEALVRWEHPRHGLIGPDRFVPLAESAGMMQELTDYVLNEGLGQLGAWRRAGFDLGIAVNISTRNLNDLGFPASVSTALERSGVPAEFVELELTETALMVDQTRALKVLYELDDLGVELAIDDYGTGYSSLAYLRRLPMSVIKIDQSFIRNLISNPDDHAIVRSTISMARSLDLDVVAEGVETDDIRQQLILDGCVLAQGYHFARPMPADQLSDWFTTHQPADTVAQS
ncbi:MAG: EAL domain-containing protein [Ilumatobacter sp.]|uniref:putative bifunctional diguanylate cyclase/phosphodiesterase n=1 Tax=Ilumatobacter sp. TaxID=1967498 RepID=UPI003C772C4F